MRFCRRFPDIGRVAPTIPPIAAVFAEGPARVVVPSSALDMPLSSQPWSMNAMSVVTAADSGPRATASPGASLRAVFDVLLTPASFAYFGTTFHSQLEDGGFVRHRLQLSIGPLPAAHTP